MKGKIIRLPHVTVVPIHRTSNGWNCVVVESLHLRYPVGGYDIYVSNEDLLKGEVLTLSREIQAVPWLPQHVRCENCGDLRLRKSPCPACGPRPGGDGT